MGNSEAGILDYNRVAEKSAALFVDRIKVSYLFVKFEFLFKCNVI